MAASICLPVMPVMFYPRTGRSISLEYLERVYNLADTMQPGEVIVAKWNKPLRYQYFRNLLPDMSVTKCETCNKTYATSRILSSHRIEVHEGRTYSCDLCDKILKTRSGFFTHKRKHTEKHASLFCNTCGKSYTSIHTLKTHSVQTNS